MKVKIVILSIITLFIFTGCNQDIFDTNHTFDRIICNYNGDKFELKVDKWTDYDGERIQVTSNGKIYLLSANKCYMVND